MTWYRTGTVAVTNGSATVTLTGGDALANIFPDDGFIGPDGKTYGIATIGGAGSFTLQTNYGGPTASGQAYGIIPVADYVQLRDQIEAVNTLITAYQTIAINAGVGLFAPGSAAAPGVRGQGHTGTGLVWNGDNTLSVSVAGTIVATFTTGGNRFPDGTVGTPGISFVSDTNTGIYRPAPDTLGFVTGGVERARITSGGNFGLGITPTVLMHIRGGPAGATQLRLDSSATQPNIAFYNGDPNANNRNWALVSSRSAFGDFVLMRSNAAGGDPLAAGTAVWSLTNTGAQTITSATDVKLTLAGSDNPGIEFYNAAAASMGRIEFTDTGPNIRAAVGDSVTSMVAGVSKLDVSSTAVTTTVPILVPLGGGPTAPTYSFATDTDTGMFRYAADHLGFATGGVMRYYITSAGHLVPIADNTYSLGTGANRMSVIYAGTGTINTSDEDEKTWRGKLTKAELKAGTRIIGEIGLYQWNDAIAEKGKDARVHVGVRAQQVWRIMAEEGLVDPITDGKPGKTPYAFLCWDEWDEQTEPVMAERTVKAKFTGKGTNRVEVEPERVEQYDTGKTRVTMEAGNRYGVRTDQLIMFLIAAQEARIAALEERLNND